MAKVTDHDINEIRQNADIVEIIKSYIPLTPKGKNYFGVCPFHQDHSPSMSVSKEKQLFKCFSCGAGGNVFQFVKEYENISFIEAVEKVAQKIGMNFHLTTTYQKTNPYQEEEKIMNLASLFFQNNLNTVAGEPAKKYLASRHLGDTVAKMFGIGLAIDQNAILNLFQKQNISPTDLEKLGLVRKKELQYFDVFQNRITFPIENPEGVVVGFTARTLDKDGTPKYLNSKETILFKKGQVLYNYHRAKEKVRLQKKVIMVEGNMDAIRMTAEGFPNTVALMGTSLTDEQINLLRKLRVPIILMLDNDEAGKINTYQNGLLLEKSGLEFMVVRLSQAKDPDEYLLKYGPEAMTNLIEHPISFLEFKLDYLKENKNLQDSKELVGYLKEVLKTIQNADDLTKEVTIRKLANEYEISYEILQKELSMEKPKALSPPVKPVSTPLKVKKYDLCAQAILYYMMNDVKYLKMYQNHLGYFASKEYREVANEIVYYYQKNKMINLADFLSYAENSLVKEEIFHIIKENKDDNLTPEKMEEYLLSLKAIIYERELKVLKQNQRQTLDINEKIAIGEKITKICKQREELNKERSVKNDKV